jgi:D-3-phosphoglycerate dehydrogenase
VAACKKGLRLINTARGDLIDEAALVDAIRSGQIGGAALDVYQQEPTKDHTLQMLPQVVASPHIAASTREGQELVGVETAMALRDFLRDGVIRNAVNFPSVSTEEFKRLQPFVALGEKLGAFLAQMNDAQATEVSIRYYGDLAEARTDLVANAVLVGLLRPSEISGGTTLVNARSVATARGLEVVESRSNRARNYTSVMSVKLHTAAGDLWAEGAVFEHAFPRLVMLDGIGVEATLEGTMIVMRNNDRPGVIGHVGTVLGRHGINVASFALGREQDRAIGLVTVDEPAVLNGQVLEEIRGFGAIREARVVRV